MIKINSPSEAQAFFKGLKKKTEDSCQRIQDSPQFQAFVESIYVTCEERANNGHCKAVIKIPATVAHMNFRKALTAKTGLPIDPGYPERMGPHVEMYDSDQFFVVRW